MTQAIITLDLGVLLEGLVDSNSMDRRVMVELEDTRLRAIELFFLIHSD
jgi:hypothetical protein